MKSVLKALLLSITGGLIGNWMAADVRCPPIFSDHMVLQRNLPLPIWGTAEPAEEITVTFGNQSRTTIADPLGKWDVLIGPLEANPQPQKLIVMGKNTLTFENVLVGEVWLCSGQSNMEKPLGKIKGQRPTDNYKEELQNANYPHLRLFKVPRNGKELESIVWQACSPQVLEESQFSAVGYFFGADLLNELDLPIGIIDSSFGGTMIEAWMPKQAFTDHHKLAPLLHEPYFAWVDGVQATELFQSMIEPIIPFALRGFLWYQGESNLMAGDSHVYADKQIALMKAWRTLWNRTDAPFYFVQLAPFNYSEWKKFPKRQTPLAWPAFAEVQMRITLEPHTGIVITTDLAGDATDIHPTQKKPIGLRLANLALAQDYGQCTRIAQSPAFTELVKLNKRIRLSFANTGTGLQSRDGEPLTHFQIAGANGHFRPAKAMIISNDTVEVWSEEVSKPIAARFAWDEQAMPNLINSAGLPAAPFRTDRWPVQIIRQLPRESSN